MEWYLVSSSEGEAGRSLKEGKVEEGGAEEREEDRDAEFGMEDRQPDEVSEGWEELGLKACASEPKHIERRSFRRDTTRARVREPSSMEVDLAVCSATPALREEQAMSMSVVSPSYTSLSGVGA
jgi:hypothetical protein